MKQPNKQTKQRVKKNTHTKPTNLPAFPAMRGDRGHERSQRHESKREELHVDECSGRTGNSPRTEKYKKNNKIKKFAASQR